MSEREEPDRWVARSFDSPHVALQCRCGWDGTDGDIGAWDVQSERDRVVRRCPGCERPVPEWGTIRPIEAAVRVARGPLERALGMAGELDT